MREAEGGEVVSHHGGRDDAIAATRQLARERDGAEVRIHEPEGGIEDREEVGGD